MILAKKWSWGVGWRITIVLFLVAGNVYAQQLAKEAVERGKKYVSQGLYKEAIKEFTDVIAQDSKNKDAYYNRGLAYQYQDRLDKALIDYNQAIKLDPKDSELYYNRGIVYYYQNYPQQAISDWSKAIELSPATSEVYQKRAFAYLKTGDYDKCWKDVHKIEELGYRPQAKLLQDLKSSSGREK